MARVRVECHICSPLPKLAMEIIKDLCRAGFPPISMPGYGKDGVRDPLFSPSIPLPITRLPGITPWAGSRQERRHDHSEGLRETYFPPSFVGY